MRIQLIALVLTLAFSLSAQKVINVRYAPTESTINIGSGINIPSIAAGYTLWLPKSVKPKGMIVFTYENRDSTKQDALIRTAMKKGLAVIFLTTSNPLEFLFSEKNTKGLAEDITRVCSNFNIPSYNLLYAGHSLAGTRALKLAIFTKQSPMFKSIAPKAIAISDVPLDMNRFYNACQKDFESELLSYEMAGNFSAMEYLSNHLDGTPTNSKARYTSYSPYSKTVKNGGNAPYFNDTYIRAYVDSSINWTNEKLGRNAYDLANFVNQLKLLGSEKAVLIQSKAPSNSISSWDIVNERELVEWFARLCAQTE